MPGRPVGQVWPQHYGFMALGRDDTLASKLSHLGVYQDDVSYVQDHPEHDSALFPRTNATHGSDERSRGY